MGVDLTVDLSITGKYSVPQGIGSASYDIKEAYNVHFLDGSTSGLLDQEHQNAPTSPIVIAAGADLLLDLSGTVPNTLGFNLAMGHVNVLRIKAELANTANLLLGGAASNAWFGPFNSGTSSKQQLTPGGIYLAVDPGAGWLVTPGTADILRINNPGVDPANVHLLIAGRST